MLLVSVYLIILIRLTAVPFSSFCVFLSLCVAFHVLALVFLPWLYSAAYYRTAFLVEPAEEDVVFLTIRVVSCVCLLCISSVFALLVFLFLVYLFSITCFLSLLSPFLATMS